jgi:hypothetical protein
VHEETIDRQQVIAVVTNAAEVAAFTTMSRILAPPRHRPSPLPSGDMGTSSNPPAKALIPLD